ncbi:unnamed protein product [Brachionus calyciflorus]|uniref:Vacuolar protein sorting-associated protein 54 C-terminal domain-containing protein n=1 Tax=Brachionus calyciflorus TaxID=104777 RepID=A0A814BGT5_9BILA|nr:unnamed protein product [Brachionus calyciflorus]
MSNLNTNSTKYHDDSPKSSPTNAPKSVFSSNLAAVLNDPRKDRSKKSHLFTKTWGSDFTDTIHFSTNKSDLNLKHFETHLNELNERIKKHNQNKTSIENNNNSISKANKFGNDNSLFDLENIPKIFFDSNFNLSDRNTFETIVLFNSGNSLRNNQIEFDKLSPRKKINNAQSCKNSLDKFSFYLDIIESHITKQISAKANTFFTAIQSQDEVQDHISKTSTQVKQIRKNIHLLNKNSIMKSIRILHLVNLRVRYEAMLDKLELLSTVYQNQPAIQIHLASSEYNGALDIISFSQEILRKELRFIRSLRHFDSQFQEIGKAIEKMLNQDFVKYLIGELGRDFKEECKLYNEEKLFSLVSSFVKIRSYDFIEMSRDEINLFLKSTIKLSLVEIISKTDLDDDENEQKEKMNSLVQHDVNNFKLIDRVKLLKFQEFLDLFSVVLNNFRIVICRIQLIVNFMINVFNETKSNPQTNVKSKELVSQNGWFKAEDKLNDLLTKSIDYVQENLIGILDAKFKANNYEKINSQNFSLFSNLIDHFLTEIDKISKNKTATLRSWLQNQSNKFLNKYHTERKDKLILAIESESWKISDLPADFQTLLDNIVKNFLKNPPNFTYNIVNSSSTNFLYVNDEKFLFFGIVVVLFKLILEYIQLENDLPWTTYDVMSKLIELFTIFNIKIFKMILGVGAIEMGLLKIITFKTLALTLRSLELVLQFLPMTKDYFLSKISDKKANAERQFNKIISDYQEHITQLNNKLIFMVDDIFRECISTYEVKAPVPSQCFRSICSQIEKVHQILIDTMSQSSIVRLFTEIHDKFKTRLRERLTELNISNDGGPIHALIYQDMMFYMKQFKSLRGLNAISINFMDIWS